MYDIGSPESTLGNSEEAQSSFPNLHEVALVLWHRWRLLTGGSLAFGAMGLALSFLIPPTFTARTVFLPPQPPQSSATTALASLGGALSGLAGGAGLSAVKTTGDQYVSLLQSANIQDRLIDRFELMRRYDAQFRFQARNELTRNVRVGLGKKDGLITLEADADSPELAADLANAHVAELRRLTSELALTEAQQRRIFFEGEVKRTQEHLASAQQTLQQSGFNAGTLKAEPKIAAENYARLSAEVTAADAKLQALRRTLADAAPEVQRQQAILAALRAQLSRLEVSATAEQPKDANYISKYREYRYQETLFELFSRQFEAARLDEARESNLIQVIDKAAPPERKTKPKRAIIAISLTIGGFVALALFLIGQKWLVLHTKTES